MGLSSSFASSIITWNYFYSRLKSQSTWGMLEVRPPMSILGVSRPPEVAVIIFARNEEENIRECLKSLLDEIEFAKTGGHLRLEAVVLVDSASTDRTVEIARRYPIRIIELPKSWPLSPAAGMYTGFMATTAPIILFMPGDAELEPGWLPTALALLKDPEVGAVSGHAEEVSLGDSVLVRKLRDFTRQARKVADSPEACTDSFGMGVIRREAIMSVGGIQPFLKGAEDRDLGFRMIESGWKIRVTQENMARHKWSGSRPMTYIEYFRSLMIWSLGDGQAFRLRFRNRAFRTFQRRRYLTIRHLFSYAVGLSLLGLGALNSLVAFQRSLALVALVANVIALTVSNWYRLRKGWSWRELAFEFHAIPYSLIRHACFILGMLKATPAASEYPMKVEPHSRSSESE